MKKIVTIITIILVVSVIFFAKDEIAEAFKLMSTVNVGIFLLLLPTQFISYFATGQIFATYLRARGDLKKESNLYMTRMALEINFVNHIVAVPGVAGFSYLGWLLNHKGVSVGRATMTQMIRILFMFLSYAVLSLASVLFLILDHNVSRLVVFLCVILTLVVLGIIIALVYFISDKHRVLRFSKWITNIVNKIINFISRKKKKTFLKLENVNNFFIDMHQDYLEIKREKKILIKPFIWSFVDTVLDVSLFFITFWALGYVVNPAILFIAFSVSGLVSIVAVTPSGAGIYEAVMIGFLASAGVPADSAIAGTLLSRIILVMLTIVFGYIFYQLTINKYGKITPTDI